jgi:indolepyruvate ferredoxin oxidoreductase beta subunit
MSGPGRRYRIFLAGVGGMGAMTVSRVLGEAALRAGLPVVVGEIHGMSQRGGVVHSAVLIGPGDGSQIDDGEADLLLALEPIEALRALAKAHPDALAVVNTHPVIPYTVAVGGAAYPDVDRVLEQIADAVGSLIAFDAHQVALGAGSARAANVALLGALAASGALPFAADHLEEVIGERAGGRAVNLRAYHTARTMFSRIAGGDPPRPAQG